MKPLYIRMQAFGSYQQAEIDFAGVPGGLFLITGDTGAGKTTIFDAITFALFDETSGGKRSGEMMRSQYARQDLITEVEFRFLYYDQIYTIIRRPKQDKYKAKTNDDGSVVYEKNKTPLGPDVELILPDGTSYPGKKTETDKKIREIIGLDAAQFTQIAMLAQGDFMKLLQASSKDRMEIFAKIFDTRIYQFVEQELMNRAKESNIALKKNEEVLHLELQRLRRMENSKYTECFEEASRFRASAKAEEVTGFIHQLIAEAEEQQSILAAQDEANREKYEGLRTSLANAETFNASWDKYQGFLQTKEELDNRQKDMNLLEERLTFGKKADAVHTKEQAYTERKGEAEHCRKALQTMQDAILTMEQQCKESEPLAAKKQALYEKEQPLLSGEIARIEAMYPQYARYEEAILKKQEQQKACAALEKEQNEREALLREKTEEKQKLLQQKADLEGLIEHVEVLDAEIRAKQELAEELKHLSLAMKALEDAKAEGRKLRLAANETAQKQIEEEERYNRLYQQFLDSQAAILARSLKEGEPCPVCGSRHHEPVVHTGGELVESHTLKAAQAQLDAIRKEAQENSEALMQAITAYKASEQDVLKNGRKYYDDAFQLDYVSRPDVDQRAKTALLDVKQLEERRKTAEKNQKALQACTKRLAELEQELLTVSGEYQMGGRTLQEAQVVLAGLQTTAETLKQQLVYATEAEARGEAENCHQKLKHLKAEWESALDTLQKQKARLQEAQGALQTQQSVLQNLLQKQDEAYRLFAETMENQGFLMEASYRECLMGADALEQAEEALKLYRQQVQENSAQIRTLEDEMKGRKRQDTTACREAIDALNKEMEESRTAVTRLFSLLENNRDVERKVEALYKKRETMLQENAVLRNLDNTANGKLSGKHLKFQTYIQRRYFKQIVDNANKRLYIMSGSQFILQCRDTEALGSQGYVGLDLDVYSIVNDQTRDVKTLSGGESFMAALALALGMADMIQNTASSVHIDTMFIDEGFGSLSEETRNQAIAILNGLSGGRRLVGIISHVTELKNQIDRKLIVTKTEKGSKAVWEVL